MPASGAIELSSVAAWAIAAVCAVAVVTDLRRTSNGGIEATWRANLGGSCVEDGKFTAIPQE